MHLVATVGHVGHGKSALIQALTGTAPDRCTAESSRASDLGFAWLRLPSGADAAFVDVPGHDHIITTRLTEAGPACAVMFIVAADQGWTPQSDEYLAVLSALGVEHVLLVVTKRDLAEPGPVLTDAAGRIGRGTRYDIPAVAVSSVTGLGVQELVEALDQLCARLPAPDPATPARIWIDRSLSVTGGGTVVTGTLPAGIVHQDDDLLVTPAMRPVRVRELHSRGGPAAAVTGTAQVALTLTGVGRETLRRGMALIQPGRWTLTDVIDVRIGPVHLPPAPDGEWHAGQGGTDAATPGQLAHSLALHAGSARVTARVRPLGPGLARLSLVDPLPLHVGDRVLLRDPGARRPDAWSAVAGAVVLDVAPPPLARRGAAAAAARQLAVWPDRPAAADLLARHGLLRASVLFAMGVPELPEPVAGEWLADPARWRGLGHQLGEVLAAHAAAEPLAAGLPIEAARAALDLPDRRLVLALARPPFRISCGAVQIGTPPAAADPELPEAVQAAIHVLRADLAAAPFVSPDAGRLRKLGLDRHSIAAAVNAGELIRVSDQIVLAPGADVAATTILAALKQPFTAAEARQALGTTRRTAIPLLEFLDSVGVTERLADDRRLVRAQPVPHPAEPAPRDGPSVPRPAQPVPRAAPCGPHATRDAVAAAAADR
jgi:selenocysteine-specific elongation factor